MKIATCLIKKVCYTLVKSHFRSFISALKGGYVAKKRKSKKAEAALVKNGLLGRIQWNESYISLIVGILVVLFAAFFIISFSKGHKAKTSSPQISSQKTENSENIAKAKGKYYTVSQGEDLWTISEKVYKDAYSWNKIADANNIKDPFVIEPGQKLIIPKQESKFVAGAEATPNQEVKTEQVSNENPSGNSQDKTYTVKPGDGLWEIAVREYGDGFRWTDIANVNNVSGPDYIIFKDDVLKIPR